MEAVCLFYGVGPWENSCSFGLRNVFMVLVPYCYFFPASVFGVGIFPYHFTAAKFKNDKCLAQNLMVNV